MRRLVPCVDVQGGRGGCWREHAFHSWVTGWILVVFTKVRRVGERKDGKVAMGRDL